jgi:nicotinate-nucleotide--dimethylbenzimidazole phosphoribosyltransferase
MAPVKLDDLLAELPGPDAGAREAVAGRAARVLRPAGALKALDEVAVFLAGWQRTERPHLDRPACVVFVADHGVAAEGVSAYPASISVDVLRALRAGVATAPVMARAVGASFTVVDVGVGRPTGNLLTRAALEDERFAEAFEAGRGVVRDLDADLLVPGEMGIGNTTAASAIAAALFGGDAADWTGRGTGVDDATLARKTAVVERARARLGEGAHPLEVLRQLGGAELAAVAGAILEARMRSIPVLLDGFVVGAAAACLERARAGTLDHCLAAHRSAEPGHARLLERLGKAPLLDLGLRLGEASGALAALPLLRLAAAAVTDVATFEEFGLSTE